MSTVIPNTIKTFVFVALSMFGYGFISYGLQRTEFISLVILYCLLFLLTYQIFKLQKNNLKVLIAVALLFRLIFVVALPNLSQDYFRFIWDGRMILEGLNPYLHLPKDIILNPNFSLPQAQELVTGMGSLSASLLKLSTHQSTVLCYCRVLSNHSIFGAALVLRIVIIAADFGTLYFGSKLLERLVRKTPHFLVFAQSISNY